MGGNYRRNVKKLPIKNNFRTQIKLNGQKSELD